MMVILTQSHRPPPMHHAFLRLVVDVADVLRVVSRGGVAVRIRRSTSAVSCAPLLDDLFVDATAVSPSFCTSHAPGAR